jgi:hypothetical protein
MLMVVFVGILSLVARSLAAQEPQSRPLSPDGVTSAHALGTWVKADRQTYTMGGERHQDGKWIDILYGRPLLRGREAFQGPASTTARRHWGLMRVCGARVPTSLRGSGPRRRSMTAFCHGDRGNRLGGLDLHRCDRGRNVAEDLIKIMQ